MLFLLSLFTFAFATESSNFESVNSFLPTQQIDTGIFNDLICPLCKTVIQKAEDYVISHGTEKLKEYLVGELCTDKLTQNVCKTIVEKAVDLAIAKIQEEYSPEAICTTLKACQ